jgi:hypothetical protein
MMHYVIPSDIVALKAVVLKFAKYLAAYGDYEGDKESRAKFRYQIATMLAYVGGGRSPEAIMKDYNENRLSFLDRMRELPHYFAGCTEALNKIDPMPKSAWYSFLSIKEKFLEAMSQPNFAALVDELMKAAEQAREREATAEKLLKMNASEVTKEDVLSMIKLATNSDPAKSALLDRLTVGMSKERIMDAFIKADESAERIKASNDPIRALVEEISTVLDRKSKPVEQPKPGKVDLGDRNVTKCFRT